MARVKDLWHAEVNGPDGRKVKRKTARHPDNGGSKDAKRWLAVWLDPSGREKSKAFQAKERARLYARRMEEDAARGEYIAPDAGAVLFATYAKRWINSRVSVDPATHIRYETVLRLHVEPVFGGRKVGSIKPSEVQEFLTELAGRFGTSTVKGALLVLQGVFDLAVADEKLKRNPAKSDIVRPPDRTEERIVAWSDETVFAVIEGHPAHLRAIPVLGAGCGLRFGEAVALAREDIDFTGQCLHVRRQVKKLGARFVFAAPKSDKERTVPLPGWVAAYLERHIGEYKPRPYSLPWERPTGEPRTVELLFRWPTDDRHLRQRNYDELVWKPILAELGVIPEPTRDRRGRKRYATTRREGTHQLRHFFASVALAGGVNVKELAEYLGHHDPGFTLRIYSHMLPDSHERARNAIDERMRRPRLVG
jgi:integrase